MTHAQLLIPLVPLVSLAVGILIGLLLVRSGRKGR